VRLWLLLSLCLAVACEPEVIQSSQTSSTPRKKPAMEATDAGTDQASPPPEIRESDFAESERSRDPFRTYISSFVEEGATEVKSQRKVVLDQYPIDELKLVGIVTRIHPPRAMLVDPSGKGHVVKRGQFVGRAELVQAGGLAGSAYEVNWRVDRIRPTDVVLIREDPKRPDVPSATRVIALHPETDNP